MTAPNNAAPDNEDYDCYDAPSAELCTALATDFFGRLLRCAEVAAIVGVPDNRSPAS